MKLILAAKFKYKGEIFHDKIVVEDVIMANMKDAMPQIIAQAGDTLFHEIVEQIDSAGLLEHTKDGIESGIIELKQLFVKNIKLVETEEDDEINCNK